MLLMNLGLAFELHDTISELFIAIRNQMHDKNNTGLLIDHTTMSRAELKVSVNRYYVPILNISINYTYGDGYSSY